MMEGLKIHKGSVLLVNRKVQVREWAGYLENNLEDLTYGLKNATILILAGRHGREDGAIGDVEYSETLKDEATGERKNILMYNHEGLVGSMSINTDPKYSSQPTLKRFHLDVAACSEASRLENETKNVFWHKL